MHHAKMRCRSTEPYMDREGKGTASHPRRRVAVIAAPPPLQLAFDKVRFVQQIADSL